MIKYERKNPVVEAIQWTGKNREEVEKIIENHKYNVTMYMGALFLHETINGEYKTHSLRLTDWLIRDEAGQIRFYTNEKFQKTFKEKE